MPRVAVVDIGTNSTRLLVADVDGDRVRELERRTVVTRLGEGLERTGALGDEPQRRVFRVLDDYAELVARHGADIRTAVLTSAVRDAHNGARFTEAVRERYGLDAQTISGDEEARLTFLGATAARNDDAAVMVVDIGGGSTELVVGADGSVDFHASMQVGVVRHTERHLDRDPPGQEALRALAEEVRAAIEAVLPPDLRVDHVIAVAGTATQTAAMDLGLDRYDSSRVEGHRLSVATLSEQLSRLAAVPLSQRRATPGLDPDRAPTIVAGIAILLQVLEAVGAAGVEVSERDILWGRALDAGLKVEPPPGGGRRSRSGP